MRVQCSFLAAQERLGAKKGIFLWSGMCGEGITPVSVLLSWRNKPKRKNVRRGNNKLLDPGPV